MINPGLVPGTPGMRASYLVPAAPVMHLLPSPFSTVFGLAPGLGLLGIVSGGCAVPLDTGAAPGSVRHAVVVVLDGARMEETFGTGASDRNGAPTSSFLPRVRQYLLPQGTLIRPALQTGVTSTAPGHVDLLSGRNVPFAQFDFEGEDFARYHPEWPNLFHALGEALQEGETPGAIVANTHHLHPLVANLSPTAPTEPDWVFVGDPDAPATSDPPVLQAALDTLEQDRPRLLLANLHHVDSAGHFGEEGAYTGAIELLDDPLVSFWESIRELPEIGPHTVLVITTDHGRHDGDGWRSHGDCCLGCREVPILLLGPGIAGGQALEAGVGSATLHTTTDIAPTLAALLGVSVPTADGLVIEEALENPPSTGDRQGHIEPAGTGDHGAWVELDPDPAHRSRVVLAEAGSDEPRTVSEASALEARAPVLAEGTHLGLCWREIGAEDPEGYLPWIGRCLLQRQGDDTASTLLFPAERVHPWFRPGLAWEGDRLWAAWAHNPGGGVPKNLEPVRVRLARNDPDRDADEGWETGSDTGVAALFPLHPRIALEPESSPPAAWVAFESSDAEGDEASHEARYSRRIHLHRVTWSTGEDPAWSAGTTFDPEITPDLFWERQSRPDVRCDEASVSVAFLVHTDMGSAVVRVDGEPDGSTWSEPRLAGGAPVPLRKGRAVLPHVSPRFDPEGQLFWAETDGEEAWICGLPATGGAEECTGTGSPRVQGLVATSSGVRVAVDRGEGDWEIEALDSPLSR